MAQKETRNVKLDIRLTAEQWTAFQAALDAPPSPAPRLDKLLREPTVFERRRK